MDIALIDSHSTGKAGLMVKELHPVLEANEVAKIEFDPSQFDSLLIRSSAAAAEPLIEPHCAGSNMMLSNSCSFPAPDPWETAFTPSVSPGGRSVVLASRLPPETVPPQPVEALLIAAMGA